jgi:Na+/proline symporter
MQGASIAAGIFGLLLIIFLIVLAVLWIIMPFLIIGTNKRLDRIGDILAKQFGDPANIISLSDKRRSKLMG